LAPVALRAPYAKSLNPPTPLLPCKLNPKPHTPFGPNVGTRSIEQILIEATDESSSRGKSRRKKPKLLTESIGRP
jgi:hypothetical protein